MDAIAWTVGIIEIALAVLINVIHLRTPLTGPPLRIYQGSMVLTLLSLSLLAGATMIVEPESRGFFVVIAAHSAGVHSYTVRQAPQTAQQTAQTTQPAHSNVRAQTTQRSARVRRIMAMED